MEIKQLEELLEEEEHEAPKAKLGSFRESVDTASATVSFLLKAGVLCLALVALFLITAICCHSLFRGGIIVEQIAMPGKDGAARQEAYCRTITTRKNLEHF